VVPECLRSALKSLDHWAYRGGTTPRERVWLLMPERAEFYETAAELADTPGLPDSERTKLKRRYRRRSRTYSKLRAGHSTLHRRRCRECGDAFVTTAAQMHCSTCLNQRV